MHFSSSSCPSRCPASSSLFHHPSFAIDTLSSQRILLTLMTKGESVLDRLCETHRIALQVPRQRTSTAFEAHVTRKATQGSSHGPKKRTDSRLDATNEATGLAYYCLHFLGKQKRERDSLPTRLRRPSDPSLEDLCPTASFGPSTRHPPVFLTPAKVQQQCARLDVSLSNPLQSTITLQHSRSQRRAISTLSAPSSAIDR